MRFDLKRALIANWPIKLTALALSAVLWAGVAAEEQRTQLVPVALDIAAPSGRTLTQTLPEVQALYEGSGREIIKLYTAPPVIRKTIPDTVTASSFEINLSTQDLSLTDNANVVVRDITPRRIVVELDQLERKVLPVVADVQVAPDSGFKLVGPITVAPESVVVFGPESQVSQLTAIRTVAQSFPGLRSSVRRSVPLDTTGYGVVRLSPEEVRLVIEIIADAGRVMTGVPVTVRTSDGSVWESIPRSVMVTVEGPPNRLARLTPDSLQVTATPSGNRERQRVALAVRAPPGLLVTVAPDSAVVRRNPS